MTGLLRFLEHHALLYRRTWKGSMFVSFISPLLFLGAMGFGLGSLISRGPVGTVDGVTYVAFLGPGLLAATTMQTAYVEATYPILAKIQWLRTYDGMLATPLTIGNVVSGELTWMAASQPATSPHPPRSTCSSYSATPRSASSRPPSPCAVGCRNDRQPDNAAPDSAAGRWACGAPGRTQHGAVPASLVAPGLRFF